MHLCFRNPGSGVARLASNRRSPATKRDHALAGGRCGREGRGRTLYSMAIAYLDGGRLRRALLAGCERAQAERAELNRINVFPVPDGDTGTNLSLTLRSIVERLQESASRSAGEVAREVAEAGVLGARGNCGMILSHFLHGFAEAVGGRRRLSAHELAECLGKAVRHTYGALDRPVEGTMLTVMRETAEAAEHLPDAAAGDLRELVPAILVRARASLARTPELLPALKRAGVVDAGAKGFVALLDGMARYVGGEVPTFSRRQRRVVSAGAASAVSATAEADGATVAAARVGFDEGSGERHRFCVEALVRGPALPAESVVRDALRGTGDSLIVIRASDVLKVHLHTDEPERLFDYLRGAGELVTHKAEDMRAQHEAVERSAASRRGLARRPVGVLTDSACDLPDEVLNAHGIVVVPLALMLGDEMLRDRLDVTAAEFAERLRAGASATTSQPSPAAFQEGYRRVAEDAESAVAVLLGSTLSGTFAAAVAAAKPFDDVPVQLVDSRGVSLLQGLLVLKAAELAEQGMSPAGIAAEIEAVRGRSGLVFTVASFERLLASGRMTRSQAWLGSLLRIRPILVLEDDGRVASVARVHRAELRRALLDRLAERIPQGARARFGIIHVGAADVVPDVTMALRKRYGRGTEVLAAAATPVIANHVGVGAWGVAYMVE